MLLQRLVELSARLDTLAPAGYEPKAIRYVIELDGAGNLRNPSPIDLADTKNKSGQRRVEPAILRGGDRHIAPALLADNAEYTFGLQATKTKDAALVPLRHDAYLRLLTECVNATGDQGAGAVLAFIQNNPAGALALPDDFDRSGFIVFRVDGQFITNRLAIQQFWGARLAPSGEKRQCSVCGNERPILTRLQGKIKGIAGGQSTGTSYISVNAPAGESYGLEASQNSPICEDCANRFTKALNYLLSNDRHRFYVGDRREPSCLTFVFWAREPSDLDFGLVLDSPDPAQVKALLESVYKREYKPAVDDVAFYAASFSGSGGRAVVRDWLDMTIGRAKAALARWFGWQRIVFVNGSEGKPLSVYALAGATVRAKRGKPDFKAANPQHIRGLIRSALTGAPLPSSMLAQVLQRVKAERDVTYQHAALIKTILISQINLQENTMDELDMSKPDQGYQLDMDNQNPAYQCGRLLSVLEQIQKEAIGTNINTTLVDRFYQSASTTPAAVFGLLISRAQPHLSKLRRGANEHAGGALQAKLEGILRQIDAFPRILSLQGQGMFALGYYHQRAWDWAQRTERAAAKKARLDEDSQGE